MKILFTADIHIKLGQKGVPTSWAKNRYKLLIEQIMQETVKADMLIVGGDFFDKLPNMEELEIYYDFVANCSLTTLIYPGNHEALRKDTTFFTHLKRVTKLLNPLVTVIDDYTTYAKPDDELTPIFNIIPYNKLKEYEKDESTYLRPEPAPILFTHVRAEIPPHVKPEVDLSIFDKWKVVLAGDLHSYDNCQRNILYPGSPLTTSFHRSRVDTGVILFDTNTREHEFIKLNLPQLIRKTIKAGDPMVEDPYDRVIYEIEGTMSDLGSLEDNDLIDKKVVRRESDTALILEDSMTLQEEVQEYLLYVLNLDKPSVDAAINLLNNNMNRIDD